jgi:hypothetical protein
MIKKIITHSDLPNKGKRNGKQSLEKNILYYLTHEEMEELEKEKNVEFESAKQSNIGLPSEFFSSLGINQIKRRKGPQKTNHEHIVLNNYADIYLVNDSVDLFKSDLTLKMLKKLNKIELTDHDMNFKTSLGDFTSITITHAVHGIGVKSDTEFSKLRMNIFKGDSIYFIIKKNLKEKTCVYIILERNPLFFSVLQDSSLSWLRYLEKNKDVENNNLRQTRILSDNQDEKNRKFQSKWRDQLAKEMMNYTVNENEVFCPFTFITANFENAGEIYVASHIKPFRDCSASEAFDINNGLLLSATADALFDKYLITISENMELIFSFLIDNDQKLKSQLNINNKIFTNILNKNRLLYVALSRATKKEYINIV